MNDPHHYPETQSILSLEPLLDFWRSEMVPRCAHMADMFASFEARIQENPDLRDDIRDPAVLADHQDMLTALMSVAIPAAAWETEIAAALVPFTMQAFYYTPAFEDLNLDTQPMTVERRWPRWKGLAMLGELKSITTVWPAPSVELP